MWGPFLDTDARVDWEKLESVMVLTARNLQAQARRMKVRFMGPWAGTEKPWAGCAPNTFKERTITNL